MKKPNFPTANILKHIFNIKETEHFQFCHIFRLTNVIVPAPACTHTSDSCCNIVVRHYNMWDMSQFRQLFAQQLRNICTPPPAEAK